MKKQGRMIFKTIVTILFLFILLVEELIVSPLRKIRIVFVEKMVKKWSALQTIIIFMIVEVLKVGAKIYIGKSLLNDYTTGVYLGIFIALVLGFITLQIILHGKDNLMEYGWYRKVSAFIDKYKTIVLNAIKNSAAYQKSTQWFQDFKFSIFGNNRGIFSNAIEAANRLVRRHKQKKWGKVRKLGFGPAFYLYIIL